MKEIPQASEISNEIQGNGRKLVIFDWDDALFPTTVLKQYVDHTSLIAYFCHRYSQALSLLNKTLINLFSELRDHNQNHNSFQRDIGLARLYLHLPTYFQ